MRFLLIFALFFSSAFDACYAPNVVRSIASAMGVIEATAADSGAIDDCEGNSSEDTKDQNSHGHACQQCHTCHMWVIARSDLPALRAVDSKQFSSYQFFVPQPVYQSLKRPPKSLA